jgi:predicted porin
VRSPIVWKNIVTVSKSEKYADRIVCVSVVKMIKWLTGIPNKWNYSNSQGQEKAANSRNAIAKKATVLKIIVSVTVPEKHVHQTAIVYNAKININSQIKAKRKKIYQFLVGMSIPLENRIYFLVDYCYSLLLTNIYEKIFV